MRAWSILLARMKPYVNVKVPRALWEVLRDYTRRKHRSATGQVIEWIEDGLAEDVPSNQKQEDRDPTDPRPTLVTPAGGDTEQKGEECPKSPRI